MEILLGGQFLDSFFGCVGRGGKVLEFSKFEISPPWSHHLSPFLSPINTFAKKTHKFLLHVPQDTENHQPTSSSSTNKPKPYQPPTTPWAFVNSIRQVERSVNDLLQRLNKRIQVPRRRDPAGTVDPGGFLFVGCSAWALGLFGWLSKW